MTPFIVVDVEGDGLLATKIHCLSVTNDDGTHSTTDYEEMREFLLNTDTIVGHYFSMWDLPTLERILNIKIKARIIDTLPLSWVFDMDRHKHGLAEHGEDLGIEKPKIDDWHNLTVAEYIHRCEEDTKINWALWKKYWKYLKRLYDSEEGIFRYLEYLEFKMTCARLQEKNKWKIDVELATKTLETMEADRLKRTTALAEVMPKVPITKLRTYPAKPLKQDGTLSSHGKKWMELLQEKGLPRTHKEPIEVITGYEDPNPGSHSQKKDWLFSLGWKPQTFKYKTDKDAGFRAKPRAIPQLNKEAQHGGGICDSISRMFDDHPELKELDGLSVLDHRIPLMKGFLRNADADECIKAEVQGLTNTLRFQHAVVVNLPRVDRLYGSEIRGSLVARKGKILVGADQSSLEDRIKQHFINKFDPEFVKRVNVPGYDPHLDLAVMAKALTEAQAEEYKNGNKQHKPVRDIFKNGNYACQYNAGPPKLAQTAGITLEVAKRVHKAYWDFNWAIKAVAENQKVKEIDGQMWLLNPVNNFYYSLRNERDIFSTLVQGTGSYCFDVWLGFVLAECEDLIGQFHDEFVLEIEDTEEEKQRIENVILDAIVQTNNYLQLDRELGTEVQYGYRYSAIH